MLLAWAEFDLDCAIFACTSRAVTRLVVEYGAVAYGGRCYRQCVLVGDTDKGRNCAVVVGLVAYRREDCVVDEVADINLFRDFVINDSLCADALDMLPYGNEIYIIS